MVAIIGGNGLGIQNSSASTLGQSGVFGNSTHGATNEAAYVNFATGNLIVNDRDEWLSSLGINLSLTRTYNSMGNVNTGHGLNWRTGPVKSLGNLTGAVNTEFSTVTRTDSDGSTQLYVYDKGTQTYRSTDGGGAHDTLVRDANGWVWFETGRSAASADLYERYDLDGRITATGERNIDRLKYTYNANNQLATVTDANGDVVRYDYVNNNLAKIVTTPAGGAAETRVYYEYDPENRLKAVKVDMSPADNKITDNRIYQTTYEYWEPSNRIKTITQSDYTTLSFTYDGDGRVKTISDELNRVTSFDYDVPGRTTVTDASKNAVTYAYNATNELTSVTTQGPDGASLVTSIYYDPKGTGNITSIVSPSGRKTVYQYDANGNRIYERDADGRTIRRWFDANNKLGSETTYGVADPDGDGPVGASDAMIRRNWYDSTGRLVVTRSAEGMVTEYRYNAAKQVAAQIQYAIAAPVDAFSTGAGLYDWLAQAAGSVASRIDYKYDVRGQLDTATTYQRFNPNGTGVTDGTQTVLTYLYDQSGQLIKTLDGRNNATTFTYDELGRQLTRTNPNGTREETSRTFGSAGMTTVTRVYQPGQANNLYQLWQSTNLAGEIRSTYMHSSEQSFLNQYRYEYDTSGRVRMILDPDFNPTHVLYDAAGRKVAEVFNKTMVEYVYDKDGNLVKTIRYASDIDTTLLLDEETYKPRNTTVAQIRPVDPNDADRFTWNSYDAAGRLIASVDANGYLTRMEYDGAGRLIRTIARAKAIGLELIVNDKIPAWVEGEASADDRITRAFYDGDSRQIATLDASGHLTEFLYTANGRLIDTLTHLDAVSQSVAQTGDLVALRDSAGSSVSHERRLYNGKGQLVGIVDAANFLTEISYDNAGNVSSRRRYAVAVTNPAALWLSDVGVTIHDDDRITTYTYNGSNQILTEVTAGDAVRYGYDAAGRQTSVTRSSATSEERTRRQKYDSAGRLIGELSEEGSVRLAALGTGATAEDIARIWASHGISYTYNAAGNRTSMTDQLGNRTLYVYSEGKLAALISATGAWESYTYDAFGDLIEIARYTTPLSAAERDTVATSGLMPATGPALYTRYYYDNDGRKVYTANAGGEVEQTEYNAFDQATRTLHYNTPVTQIAAAISARGHKSGASEDLATALKGIAGSAVERTFYDASGRVIYTVDANNAVEGRTYDGRGNLQTVTQYGKTYGSGDLAALADQARDHTQMFEYDERNLRIGAQDSAGYKTATRFNAFGEVERVSRYNKVGTSEATNLGAIVRTFYDAKGRVRATVNAAGSLTGFRYDADGRVVEQVTYAKPIPDTMTDSEILKALKDEAQSDTNRDLRQRFVYNSNGQLVATATLSKGTGVWQIVAQTYDNAGRVEQRTGFAKAYISDPASVALSDSSVLEYIAATRATDAADSSVRYAYDANGRVIATATALRGAGTSREWAVVQITYDGAGNVAQRIERATVLVGAAPTAVDMLAVKAPATTATSFDAITYYQYDAMGRVIASAKALGAAGTSSQWALTTRSYDTAGNLLSVREYAKALTNVTAATNLVGTRDDSRDRFTRYSYDAGNRLVATVDANGTAVSLAYDTHGNVIKSTRHSESVSGTGNLGPNYTPKISQKDISSWTFYDKNNRPVFQVDATGSSIDTYGVVTQRRYDSSGNVTYAVSYATLLDTNAITATMTADDVAVLVKRLESERDRKEYFVYYPDGKLRYAIDALGYLTEKQYDTAGRLLAELAFPAPVTVAPNSTDSAISDAAKEAAGKQTADSRTRITRYTYDAAGNLTSVTDALGKTESYTYDALGRKKTFTNKLGMDKSGYTWEYSYDAAGRLVLESSPSLDTYTDGLKSLPGTLETPIAQRLVTRMEYDTLGNLVKRIEAADVAGKQRVTEYRYDALGRQTDTILESASVYDQSVESYAWNGEHGFLYPSTAPTRTVTVTYDALGNAVTNRDVGGNVSYKVYDKAGRVRWEIDAAGYVTGYERDAFGNVTSLTRYGTKYTGATDQATLSIERFKVATDKAVDRSIVYSYDDAGRVLTASEPITAIYDQNVTSGGGAASAAGRVTQYEYDAFGAVYRQSVYGVDASGKRITEEAVTRFYYNVRGEKTAQIAALSDAGGKRDGYLTTYQYDAAGNVQETKEYAKAFKTWTDTTYSAYEASAQDRTTRYEYDKLDRKTAEIRVGVTYADGTKDANLIENGSLRTSFEYDAVGNLSVTTDAAGDTTRTYYDKLGRVIATGREQDPKLGDTPPSYAITELKLDIHGNIVLAIEYGIAGAVDANGVIITDAMRKPDTTRITATRYDNFGHAVETLDAQQFSLHSKDKPAPTIKSQYDVFGRLVKQWRTVTDNNGAKRTAYQITEYDALGRVSAVITPGLIDTTPTLAADWKIGKENRRISEYNAFGEVIKTYVRTGTTVLGDSVVVTDYDQAGHAWRTNADGGVYKVSLHDVHGNVTAIISSTAARTEQEQLKLLASANDALPLQNVLRTEKRYDLLGHMVDSRVLADTRLTVLVREAGAWIQKTVTNDQSLPNSLIVIGDAAEAKLIGELRYRVAGGTWITAVAPQLRVVEGLPVFDTAGLAPGQYQYEVMLKPESGESFSRLGGTLTISQEQDLGRAKQIIQMFLLLFNRAPDLASINYWIESANKGVSNARMFAFMLESKEWQDFALPTSADIIKKIFGGVFSTPTLPQGATPDQLAVWTQRWDKAAKMDGTETLERGQLLADLLDSVLQAKQGGQYQLLDNKSTVVEKYVVQLRGSDMDLINGLKNQAGASFEAAKAEAEKQGAIERHQKQLIQLYITLFDRAPDIAGLESWRKDLAAGHPLEYVADRMLNDKEAQQPRLYPSEGLTPRQYNELLVNRAYSLALDRNPSDTERTAWGNKLNGLNGATAITRGQFIAQFVNDVVTYTGTASQRISDRNLFSNKVAISYAAVVKPDKALPSDLAASALLDGVTGAATVKEAAEKALLFANTAAELARAARTAANTASAATPFEDFRVKMTRIYLALYGRFPDKAGLESYLPPSAATAVDWATIARDFASKPEGKAMFGEPGQLPAASFVQKLYRNALGTIPTSAAIQAEMNGFVARLAAGESRDKIACEIAFGMIGADKLTADERNLRAMLDNRTAVGLTVAASLVLDAAAQGETLALVRADDYSAALNKAYSASQTALSQKLTQIVNTAKSAASLAEALSASATAAAQVNNANSALTASPAAKYRLQLSQLYVALLRRSDADPIDVAGIQHYIDANGSLENVAQEFVTTGEGLGYFPAALTSAAFVDAVVKEVLGDASLVPAAQRTIWVNQLSAGSTALRGRVALAIVNSVLENTSGGSTPSTVYLAARAAFLGRIDKASTQLRTDTTELLDQLQKDLPGLKAAAKQAADELSALQGSVKTAESERDNAIRAVTSALSGADTVGDRLATRRLLAVRLYATLLMRKEAPRLDEIDQQLQHDPVPMAQGMMNDNPGLFPVGSSNRAFIQNLYSKILGRDPNEYEISTYEKWLVDKSSQPNVRGMLAIEILTNYTNYSDNLVSHLENKKLFDKKIAGFLDTLRGAAGTGNLDAYYSWQEAKRLNQAVKTAEVQLQTAINDVNYFAPANSDATLMLGTGYAAVRKRVSEIYALMVGDATFPEAFTWMKAIRAGTKTELDLIDSLQQSYPQNTVRQFVETLYQRVLGRPGDPKKEIDYYVAKVASQGKLHVAHEIVISDEARDDRLRDDGVGRTLEATLKQRAEWAQLDYSLAVGRKNDADGNLTRAKQAYQNFGVTEAKAKQTYDSLARLVTAHASVITADDKYLAAVTATNLRDAKKIESDAATLAANTADSNNTKYSKAQSLGGTITSATSAFASAALAASKLAAANTTGNAQLQRLVQVYFSLLNRAPTLVELYMATDRLSGGASLGSIADSIIRDNPTLYPAGMTNTTFVNQLYQYGLGRGRNNDELGYYENKLAAGVSRGDVAVLFIDGANVAKSTDTVTLNNRARTILQEIGARTAVASDVEAIMQRGAQQVRQQAAAYNAAGATALAASADAKRTLQLTRLYVAIFGRAPDNAGLNSYAATLRSNPTMTLGTIAQLMLDDAEGRLLYPSTLSNADFVTALFKRALGRGSTAMELSKFTSQLAGGTRGQVVSSMIDAVVADPGNDILQQATRSGYEAKVSASLVLLAAQAGADEQIKQAAVTVLQSVKGTVKEQDAYLLDPTVALASKQKGQQVLAGSNNITVDRWGNILTIADARDPNYRVTYKYNHDNQLISQSQNAIAGTAAANVVTTTRYDALGRVAAQIDFNGNKNAIVYDSNGNAVEEHHADGGVVRSAYNLFGNRLSVQQPDTVLDSRTTLSGVLTNYTYDYLGRLSSTSTGKAVDVWVADSDGSDNYGAIRETAQKRLEQRYEYDQLGRQLATIDANGVKSLTDYDADGNVIKTATQSAKYGYQYEVRTAFDALHRKIGSIDALKNTMSWTYSNGVLSTSTDMGGVTTNYSYDQSGRLLRQWSGSKRWQDMNYSYVGVNLTRVYDGYNKVATNYTYDAAGNRLTERQVYDTQGPVVTPTRVQNNELTYDMQNRLKSVKDDLYKVDYTYDGNGNRMTVTTKYGDSAAFTVYNEYDAMNRQTIVNGDWDATKKSAVFGRQGHKITYDKSGNRLTDTFIGKKVVLEGSQYTTKDALETTESYTYDDAGRLSTVTRDGLEIDYRRYDAAGRVAQSGLRASSTSSVDNVLKALGINSAGHIYSYDAGGHITRQRDLTIQLTKSQDIFFVKDGFDLPYGNPYGGYDAMGNLLGYTVARQGVKREDNVRYVVSYALFDTYKEAQTGIWKTGTWTHYTNDTSSVGGATGSNYSVYDANGNRKLVVEGGTGQVLNRLWYDAEGHIQSYQAKGEKERFNLIVNGNVLGEETQTTDNILGSTYMPVNSPSLSAAPSLYSVQSSSETLRDIAKSVWGDANLWYLIADANGLSSDAKLEVGQTLRIPARANTVHNDYNTYKPYDPSEQIGSTAPAMPAPSSGGGGCGGVGQLVMVVVAVVATIFTAGAAAPIFGVMTGAATTFGAGLAVMTGQVAFGAGMLAAAAVGGAVGSIASQAVGIATGAQDGFSWKNVALSAIGSGAGAGMASAASGLGNIFANTGPAGAAARTSLSSVAAQGVGIATGLQDGFSWRNVAASAVGAAAGSAVAPSAAKLEYGELFTRSATGFVAGTVTAIARGGKIEVARIATDAFGNALGNSLAGTGSQSDDEQPAGRVAKPSSREQAERNMYGGMTSSQLLGGDKDWLSALGAYDGPFGTGGNDERIPNYQAPIPQVVVDGGDVNQRLNAIFGLTPKNIGPVQVQPTQIDSMAAAAASDRRFYTSREAGASNGYSAAAWHIGGLLNEVGYDLAKTARGAFQLVTDSDTQAAAYNALKFAVNNPGIIANNAIQGFKDFSNKPFAEQADSVFKFGAGGLATAGAGKVSMFAVDGTITGATATAKWLAPKAGELLQNYMYRSGSLAYAVPPTSAIGDALNNGIPARLYHYTNEAGLNGILDSGRLNPSLKALNPNDVRYGNGQYLSDVVPGTMTPAQLSRQFINNPFQGARYTHFVEINTKGLDIIQGRPGVFVVPNEVALDLGGRLTNSGKVVIGK